MTRMDDRTKRLNALGDGWTRLAAMAEQLDADRLTLLERIAEGMGRPKGLRDQADTPTVDTSGRPLHSDPTGEAAMHPARNDLAAFDRLIKQGLDALMGAMSIAELHQVREANPREQTEAARDNGDPGCTSCTRIAKWTPPHRGDLCRWCYDWRTKFGDLPNRETLTRHHDGHRINEPAPSSP